MSDLKIPSSQWVIEKRFFKAKVVDDFASKYPLWLAEYDGYDGYIDDDAIQFADSIQEKGIIELYQFPFDHNSNNCKTVKYEESADYFEKEDDNQVMPRHLFELI